MFRRARNAPLAGPREQGKVRHLACNHPSGMRALVSLGLSCSGSRLRACDGHCAEHGATHWIPPERASVSAAGRPRACARQDGTEE